MNSDTEKVVDRDSASEIAIVEAEGVQTPPKSKWKCGKCAKEFFIFLDGATQ
jgi:hypothetical protein